MNSPPNSDAEFLRESLECQQSTAAMQRPTRSHSHQSSRIAAASRSICRADNAYTSGRLSTCRLRTNTRTHVWLYEQNAKQNERKTEKPLENFPIRVTGRLVFGGFAFRWRIARVGFCSVREHLRSLSKDIAEFGAESLAMSSAIHEHAESVQFRRGQTIIFFLNTLYEYKATIYRESLTLKYPYVQ